MSEHGEVDWAVRIAKLGESGWGIARSGAGWAASGPAPRENWTTARQIVWRPTREAVIVIVEQMLKAAAAAGRSQ